MEKVTMRAYCAAIILLVTFMSGCGSSNGSSSSSNTSVAPFTFEPQNIYLHGGHSETYLITLNDENVTASKLSIIDKISATLTSSSYSVSLSSSDENVASISPKVCVLSSSTPTCEVTVFANDLWNPSSSNVVIGKATLSANVGISTYQIANVETASNAPSRIVEFENQCPFDVWAGFAPSSAAQIGCTPNNTAQSNCPANYVCYAQSVTTNYCVAGIPADGNYTKNLTKMSDINLTASTCMSNTVDTNTSSATWGQCTCSTGTPGQCPSHQVCMPATSGANQCFYNLTFDTNKSFGNNGLIEANTTSANGATLPFISLPLSSNTNNTIFFSGNFYFKTGCSKDSGISCEAGDPNGDKPTSPSTRLEYTFLNSGTDYYDVSYINGVNVPSVMAPKFLTNMNITWNKNAYYCTPAGGTEADLLQAYKKSDKNTSLALQGFGSSLDWNKTIDANTSMLGFNYVTFEQNQTCSPSQQCPTGQTCGLNYANVLAGSAQTTCGYRAGYWTYAQFCSVNTKNGYKNDTLGVDCNSSKKKSYSLCKPFNDNDYSGTGPARSCFNANQTVSGNTCCGYAYWEHNSSKMPMTSEANQTIIKDVNTTYWTDKILPSVKFVKKGAMLAYSYQYDDPFSTFQCAYTTPNSKTQNATSYKITLCPQKNTAGIATHNSASCEANVSATTSYNSKTIYFTNNNFNINFDPSMLSINSIYDLTNKLTLTSMKESNASAGYLYYDLNQSTKWASKIKVVAKSTSDGTCKTCYFMSTPSSCLALDTINSDQGCVAWSANPPPWYGRFIPATQFSKGSTCQ